ncbi:spermatogenesis-associated protein 17-like [Macrosteles quadrilineatus]|uniref:spermatogenesis-associated protein 17-like n=1 Tax=Macrosteles quadrilineatus TaxID=74068 RepID=UPI0023E189DA|nr:spermatogenesis-associated protein 17-like [Macrosteles quadrilineatus]
MACIEHYIKDANNLFDDIVQRHKIAQANVFKDYQAARTIQKCYRGYLVRKHLKYLHSCATTIQKYWRGHVDRKGYERLLKESVHKLYWEHYNNMATKIQKVWRGHFIRTRVFSYYQLKDYIKGALQMNKEFMEKAKEYEEMTKTMIQRDMDKECQDKFDYLSRRVHHLLRTYQIEGIFSIHGTKELSYLEKVLTNVKFVDFMKTKRLEAEQKKPKKPEATIFKGRLRECEEVWLHRNDPGKYSLATGEYRDDERVHEQREKIHSKLRTIQDHPMQFGPVRHKDANIKLDNKSYQCPPLHQSQKNFKD